MPEEYRNILVSAATAALLFSAPVNGAGLAKSPAEYFGDYGYCALVLGRNRHDETFIEAGPKQCRQQLSPCSTFKIPNTLIGLQTGVVSGPEDVKNWDGTVYSRKINNSDHSLQSAISHSVVWYFRELARDVGEQRMADRLEQLNYGNQDISAGIDRFWLSSSLKIDAYGQLELLKNLWHGTLPFNPEYQQQLRDMLALDSNLAGSLYGKTGSCLGNEDQQTTDHGWFIGWVDWSNPRGQQPSTTFFVINTTGQKAWGWEAKRIALEILKDQEASQQQQHRTE